MRGDPRVVKTEGVQDEVLKGAKTMYDLVSRVYGPTSYNVALQKSYGSHVLTHDGVTVAKDVILRDQNVDLGAELLYNASKKSNDTAGDGTTCTVLLGYHVMRNAYARIASGYNPMGLKRGIDKAAADIKDRLERQAKSIPADRLHEIATISASDPEIGKLIADTVNQAGGVGITIEEYNGLGVVQDIIEGTFFEKGWTVPHFINDFQTEEAVHENVHVLVIEKRIRDNQDIVPIIEMIYREAEYKKVLIIGNISGKALDTCQLTQNAGKVNICVVAPPVYGSQVLPFLEDMACITGGKIVPENIPAERVTLDFLGSADKVVVDKDSTMIFGGKGDYEQRQMRIDTLHKQLKSDKYNAFEKERMEKRLSKLQGKIGRIKVGGTTEQLRDETKFRVEDAVFATRAAAEQGVVPGGATTLARLSKEIEVPDIQDLNELEGYKVVLKSLTEPFRQLMLNAGEDPGYRLQQLLNSKPGYGFNAAAMTDKPINIVEAGIIDPVKVIKSIVENSCSVAGMAITLGGITQIDRKFQLEQVQLNMARIAG